MSPQPRTKVAILQGNATVAKLMEEFLEASQSFEVEFLQGSPPGAARAQLAIIDIDSGEEAAEQWIRHCDGRQLPVVLSGVRRSREAYADRPWLSRPFTAQHLEALCKEVLGPTSRSGHGDKPPPIEVGSSMREQPTVEIPDDGVPVDDLSVGEMGSDSSTTRQSAEELLDVLDIDGTGSMILEIEDVSSDRPVGGMLVKEAQRRTVPPQELDRENPWADVEDTEVESGTQKGASSTSGLPEASKPVTPSTRAEVTAVSSLSELASRDFSGAHRVASLIAEHWDRIGLTARPADRADRLQRILAAMLSDGIDGVLEVLKRIPPVKGFSGGLETIPVVELLHTIRDRKLRGRLEVGLNGHSFVLYIDETRLDGINSLGERTDRLFVKILRDQGAIDDSSYRRYRQLAKEYHGESLEMKLRRDPAIDEEALFQARKERAQRLLGKMCRGRRGTFAFIEMCDESGQSWPTKPLRLNIDSLLLENFRRNEPSQESPSESILGADLVMDSERAARLSPDALTEAERQTLDFFERGGNIDGARESLPPTEEPVDRVVRRLERLELLRRLGEKNQEQKSADAAPKAQTPQEDPHQKTTAVSSSWNLQILDVINEGEDSWDDETTERAPEELVEETREDVGFSTGVPEDFEASRGFRSEDDDRDS